VSVIAAAPPGNAYRVTLPDFEGPLDLLLHLCRTNEIDILNIPIAFVSEKYLEYLEALDTVSIDVAADYLVMAATLAYLKARELVPTPEPVETLAAEDAEEGDPRQELIRRLLEYQKYKDAAEKLSGQPILGRVVFERGASEEAMPGSGPTVGEHSVWKLIAAWAKILDKKTPPGTHDVVLDRISIEQRLDELVDRLALDGGSVDFDLVIDRTLPAMDLRQQVVVTLLAVLELARLRLIRVVTGSEPSAFTIAQIPGADLRKARQSKPPPSGQDFPDKNIPSESAHVDHDN
jgi:segregation and condensation protein A